MHRSQKFHDWYRRIEGLNNLVAYITLRSLKGRYHGNQFLTQNRRIWRHSFIRRAGIPKRIAVSQC